MFALIDCNNFYASCERVFNPKLIGEPIAILSNNDGLFAFLDLQHFFNLKKFLLGFNHHIRYILEKTHLIIVLEMF